MADVKAVLAQYLEITALVIKMEQRATINISIGNNIKFEFCNKDGTMASTKRKVSPSQMKRNQERKLNYDRKKMLETADLNENEINDDVLVDAKDLVKIEPGDQNENDLDKTTSDAETQTENVLTKSVGTCTDDEFERLEVKLELDSNGKINGKENEVILEMKMSHDFNNWEAIEKHVEEKLGMNLIGKPWIANNGRQFITVGFKTLRRNFEEWKIKTFNWQDSGIQAVTSSRLYR